MRRGIRSAHRGLAGLAAVLCALVHSGARADVAPAKDVCRGTECYESIPQAEQALRNDPAVHGPSVRRDRVYVPFATAPELARASYVEADREPATTYDVSYGNYNMSGGCTPPNDPNRQYLCKNEQDAIQASYLFIRAQYASSCQFGPATLVTDYSTSYQVKREDPYSRRREGYLWWNPKVVSWRIDCSGSIYNKSASIWKEQGFVCPSGVYYEVKTGYSEPASENDRRSVAPYLCRSDWSALLDFKIKQVASCPANAHPCHPATGDKSRRELDFEFAGRPFYRYYHSLQESQRYAAGVGWSLSFSDRIGKAGTSYYRMDDGSEYQTFTLVQGAYYRDAQSHDEILEVLGSAGYQLYTRDGEVRKFDAQGRLVGISDPSGPEKDLTLQYYEGRLSGMTDGLGRTASLRYLNDMLDRVELPDGGLVVYSYDSDTNLVAVGYTGGAVKQYLYHESGLADPVFRNHLTGIVAEDGTRHASFGYDQYGRVKSSTLHGGTGNVATTTLDYDTADNVTVHTETGGTRGYTMQPGLYRRVLGVADAAGAIAKTYDAEGRLSTSTDRNGTQTQHAYAETTDPVTGQPASVHTITEAVGLPEQRVTTEVRDLASNRVLATTVGDRETRIAYNARLQPATVTVKDLASGQTRVTAYAYCEAADVAASGSTCPRLGLPKSVDGPRTDVSDVTTYAYYPSDDASCASAPSTCPHRKGELWKTTNALGQVTEVMAYDGAGRPRKVKDANGVVTDLEYHPRGWLSAQKVRGSNDAAETDDAITRIEYWPTGLVKKLTQPDGDFTAFTYDAAQRLTDVADNAGNKIHYTLDNAGNRLQEDTRDASGTLKRTLSRVFDTLGQLQTVADAQANPTDFTYDADGNPETTTDALGRVTNTAYDPLNRLKQTVQDAGGIQAQTTVAYDALDHPTQVTDPKGLTTTYAYNGFGEVVTQSSPDTGTTGFTYDSAGNRKTRTDARGITATYSYDALNRVTAIAYPDTSRNVGFVYDTAPAACTTGETFAKGRLARMTDASGSTGYCHDRFGSLVRKTQTTNGQAFTVRYAYTRAGRLSAITYPNGSQVDYVRNAVGQVTEVGVTQEGSRQVLVTGVAYAPFGPATGWAYGNGRSLQRSYDQDYRPTGLLDSAAGGLDLGLGYDAAGQLTGLGQSGTTIPEIGLDYDALGRLTAFKDAPTDTVLEAYAYDATGNRTSATTRQTITLPGDPGDPGGGPGQTVVQLVTTPYTYPAGSHRLEAVGDEPRLYDAAGNTIRIGSPDAPSGARWTYVHGADGRMQQAQLASGTVSAQYAYTGRGERVRRTRDGVETYTVYDEAGHWLGDYGATGTPKQQAIWLDDQPVGLLDGMDLRVHYVEPDHLGTPRAVIEPVRNVAVWRWGLKSEAFGASAPDENPDADGAHFVLDLRFPGQRYDSATGLNYNYYRDYDPDTGRYAQSDPVGLLGGISTYAYASGNPLNRFDPLGLKDYTACETQEILNRARNDATKGSIFQRTQNMLSNHSGFGRNEIGAMDFRALSPADTFVSGSRKMGAAAFGNYVAGYAGWNYGGAVGLSLVMWGGVAYDFDEDWRSRGSPVPQTNTFDFDQDSRGDILAGARRAIDENQGGLTTCGCSP